MIRNVRIFEIEPGATVGRHIYTDQGNLLVEQGTPLTTDLLRKLEQWTILTVPIELPDEENVETKDIVIERFTQARIAAERATRMMESLSRGRELQQETISLTRQIIDNLKLKRGINRAATKSIVVKLVEESVANQEILSSLMTVRQYDNYLFSHSLNVSVLSIMTGHIMGLSSDELHLLGEAALMHDVGMTVVPSAIWSKFGRLSNEERFQIQKHPIFSTDIVEELPHLQIDISKAIYQHHEREDGSGYPRGTNSDRISALAKILAVADTYDAMVSERPYRQRMMPYQTMREIVTLANKSLNQDVVSAFVNHMSLYPIGSVIRLNTGELGITILANKSAPLRPVIAVMQDENGERVCEDVFVDLSKDKSLFIVEAVFDDAIMESLVQPRS